MAASTTARAVRVTHPNGKSTISISGVRSLDRNDFFRFEEGGKLAHVPRRTFVSRKPDARAHLESCGIVITDDRFWRSVVAAIEEVHIFADAPLVERCGWTGAYFGDSIGRVYVPKNYPRARSVLPRRMPTRRGTFKRWKREVAVPLTGQHLPMVAVLAALAAPLLSIVAEAQNIGLEFWGPPAKGKTTMLRIMQSVVGDPAHILNFNTTQAGLDRLFPAHRDLPFPVDEANLINQGDQFLREFAFRMANGTTRSTAFTSGAERYPFVFSTTSNRPFYEGLRGVDALTADAALQRLIPIQIPEGALGVFNHLPKGLATSGALVTNIAAAIARSHGRAMPRFLRALVDARAAGERHLKESILRDVHAFEQAVGLADTMEGKTRASSAFGLFYAAGQFARAAGILPAAWDCLAACLAAYRNYQAQLPHHTPPTARLLAIAQRPMTIDLRHGPLPSLTDEQIEEYGAFIRSGVRGRTEILFTAAIRRQVFPDWRTAKGILVRAGMLISKPGREQFHRQVRYGEKRTRFYCSILPAGLPGVLGNDPQTRSPDL